MAALILEIGTRGLHQYHHIENPVTTLGRALDNDIILSDPTVAPHHLRIVDDGDGRVEIVNLSDVNPARINTRKFDSLTTDQLPLNLELGRVRARLLNRDATVPATRPLAGDGRRSHVFGHAIWAFVLLLLCLLFGGLEFYFQANSNFKWSDLIKYVLRETVLIIGISVIALSVLERLLVNRWEIRQLVTSVSLIYLAYLLLSVLSAGLDYVFSANLPTTLFQFGWYLGVVPGAITLYLIYISHLQLKRSLLLAIFITSPIAVPALLQNVEMRALLNDFSPSARYQNSLSAFNLHLRKTVAIDDFILQARQLEAGEFAD